MILYILLGLAMLTSVAGAVCNGYGAAHKNEPVIFKGQCLWVVSNTLWVGLYIFVPAAVGLLPAYFQIITFATFLFCAAYAVYHNKVVRLE